jgi:hypothetical protein
LPGDHYAKDCEASEDAASSPAELHRRPRSLEDKDDEQANPKSAQGNHRNARDLERDYIQIPRQ